MTIADWLAVACADADRRGLSELRPLLESLARSTTALRRADEVVQAQGDDPGSSTRFVEPSTGSVEPSTDPAA